MSAVDFRQRKSRRVMCVEAECEAPPVEDGVTLATRGLVNTGFRERDVVRALDHRQRAPLPRRHGEPVGLALWPEGFEPKPPAAIVTGIDIEAPSKACAAR